MARGSRTGTTRWRKLRDQAVRAARATGQDRCPCGTFLDYHQHGLPNSAELDHITAHALGGEDDIDNVQIICRRCNGRKGGFLGQQKRAGSRKRRTRYEPAQLQTALD